MILVGLVESRQPHWQIIYKDLRKKRKVINIVILLMYRSLHNTGVYPDLTTQLIKIFAQISKSKVKYLIT